MKKFYKTVLLLIALIIAQQAFPQKENGKSPLRGEQQIELIQGYSFISSRIMAENPDMLNILMDNLVNLDFVRNTAGAMLRKIGPNWVNSIGDWVNTEGYIIRMNDADELIITGETIDPQTPIELHYGYQLIGYLPEEAFNTEEVFQNVLDNLEFVRNTAGQILMKIGPNWVNGIGDMQPGEGYLVKMYSDDILIYPYFEGEPCPGIPTITYEGQVYNTLLIGNQCWLKENLNVGVMINGSENMSDNGVIEKYCYNDDPANCEIYGGLYQWNEVMEYTTAQGVQSICPSGWHLPTDGEWTVLTDFLGGESVAGGKMKETGTIHWQSPNTGATNESWFTALPAGHRASGVYFGGLGTNGYFWTSTEYSSQAWYRELGHNTYDVTRHQYNKEGGFSTRCLQD